MRGVGPSAQFTNHPPSGPHPPIPIPNSPIVLVQLGPLVDVDALLTLLLLSPLSLSLSLFDRYHHCSWSKPWASDYITGFVFQWKFWTKIEIQWTSVKFSSRLHVVFVPLFLALFQICIHRQSLVGGGSVPITPRAHVPGSCSCYPSAPVPP